MSIFYQVLLFGGLVVAAIGGTQRGCENGWVPFGGGCYHFSANKVTWHDALKACNSMGSTLVTVECTHEFIWLQEMIYALQIEKTYPWVGATDMMEDGKWKWISDTEKVNTDGWYSHEPNGGKKENCAHYFPKRWNDAPCGAKNGYICEKRST